MNENQLKFLWDNYANNKGFNGYDEFKSLMANNNSRKVFFENSNKELGFKDYNEFESILGVKKKDGTQAASGQPVQQPGQPSAPSFGQKVVTQAFTSGEPIMTKGVQKKPIEKRPYQDIYYKPEAQPSETTQAVETPVIKAAKQDFKQTQLKSPVKAPVTPEGIQELEEKIKEPDKTFLKFQDYQTSIEDLDELEELYDEDLSAFQSKISRRPDLYAKYSGRNEQEVADFFDALSDDSNPYRRNEAQAQYKAESNALYENFVKDYKSLKSKHGQITSDLGVMTDKLISDVVNEKTYKKFLAKREFAVGPTNAEASFGEVISIDDVDKAATEIVDRYGLPTDGEAWRLVKNKIKGEVFNQYMKPKVNEELKKTNPELLAKRQQMFDAGFKADDDIYAKADSVLIALQSQYEQDAKAEMDLINSEYVGASDKLNQVYQTAVANIEKQQSALNDAYKSGKIDQLDYESAFTKLEDDKKLYYDEYQKNYPSYDQYVKKSNEINSRYNRKFEIQKKLITDKAQAELEAAYKKYSETYEEDPKLLEELNNAYKVAYDNVVKQQGDVMKMGASISANPLSSLYNSTMSAVGGVFKGWGGSMGSKSLELLGETMEQNFMMPAPRTEDFSDWADPQNLSMITGNVIGSAGLSMIPTAAAAVGTAYATGGLGLPASVNMVTSGIVGALVQWGAETIDTGGRSYLDVFERSGGDVARANQAAKRSVKSQFDIIGLYSFEALPFIGKALKFIPTQVARAGVGAVVETTTEFTQEIRQGIAEENIVEFERDPWYNFDEAINDERRRKQTLISIGPVGILGGAGQIGSKSIYQERRDAAIAQQQKSALVTALPDQRRQYIQNMVFNRNGKFANAVIASLYASGKIDEKTSADMMLEIKRAEQIKEAGKSAGLSGSKLNIYGFYSARAEEAERNAGKFAADPILSKVYEDMAKQYRDAGVEFMNGKSPDLLTLTYADGSQAIMLPEDVNALFSDPIALSLLNDKSISIEAYDENGQGPKIIEELGQRAETYAKKNRYTEASKFSSPMQGLRQNISDRIQQLYAMRADLNERQKQQEAERIRQEETAAFEQKQMQRQQQESGERDLEIERLQQQRMALGIDDVTAFFSDMKPLVATMVERMEAGQSAPQSGIKAASDYLYSKYKELTAMKSDPNRMMTIAQIESIQAQLEQDLQTLAGNPPSQKTQVNDQENIQGVSGEVGVGQEPVTTEPVEVPSAETPEAGGVLQAQREEIDPRKIAVEKAQNQLDGVNSRINPKANHPLFNVGQKHDPGNKLIVTNSEDRRTDTTKDGVEVITKILSPAEVDENGRMTKAAEVEIGIFDSYEQAQEYVNSQYNKYKAIADEKLAKAKAELAAVEAPKTQEEVTPEAASEVKQPEIAKDIYVGSITQTSLGWESATEDQGPGDMRQLSYTANSGVEVTKGEDGKTYAVAFTTKSSDGKKSLTDISGRPGFFSVSVNIPDGATQEQIDKAKQKASEQLSLLHPFIKAQKGGMNNTSVLKKVLSGEVKIKPTTTAGGVSQAKQAAPQVEEAAPAKKEKAPETKPEVKTEPVFNDDIKTNFKPSENLLFNQGGFDNLQSQIGVDPDIKTKYVQSKGVSTAAGRRKTLSNNLTDALRKIGRVFEGEKIDLRGMSEQAIIDYANTLDEIATKNERFGGKRATITKSSNFGRDVEEFDGRVIGYGSFGVRIITDGGAIIEGKKFSDYTPKTEQKPVSEVKEAPKGKPGRRERLAKLFEEPKVEVVPTEEAGVEAAPEMTPEEIRINMKPITDEMANIEMEFANNGYSIDWDYDNEIIITDKNGEIVDAEELPKKLLPLAAQYEKATAGLAGYDFDSYRKALEQSRKDVGGIETEFEEVKPLAITEKKTEKAPAKPFANIKNLFKKGFGGKRVSEREAFSLNKELNTLIEKAEKENGVQRDNLKLATWKTNDGYTITEFFENKRGGTRVITPEGEEINLYDNKYKYETGQEISYFPEAALATTEKATEEAPQPKPQAAQTEMQMPERVVVEKNNENINSLIAKKSRYNSLPKTKKAIGANLLEKIKQEAADMGFSVITTSGLNIKIVDAQTRKPISKRGVSRTSNKEYIQKKREAQSLAETGQLGLRASILNYFIGGKKIKSSQSELGEGSAEIKSAERKGLVSASAESIDGVAGDIISNIYGDIENAPEGMEDNVITELQDVLATHEDRVSMEEELFDLYEKLIKDQEEAARYNTAEDADSAMDEGLLDEDSLVEYYETQSQINKLTENEQEKLYRELYPEAFEQEAEGTSGMGDVEGSTREGRGAEKSKSKRLQRAEELRAKAQDLRDASGGTLMAGPKLLAAAYEAYATILETTESIIEAIKKFKGTKEYKDLDVNGKKELDVVLATDAVEEEISSGRDPQEAVDDLIGSQDWYGDLSDAQKEQLNEILQDDFGVTVSEPKQVTPLGEQISSIVDNYYKLKDKTPGARDAINEILDADPKLKYIYDNIRKINKQLQEAGVITDKTDGCP